jgi:hypothetical protein
MPLNVAERAARSRQKHDLAVYRSGLCEFHRGGHLGQRESGGDMRFDLPASQQVQNRAEILSQVTPEFGRKVTSSSTRQRWI